MYYELDQFHRSLSRKPRPATIIRNWERLDEAGQIFTEIHLKIDGDIVESFSDLRFASYKDCELLKSAVGKARRWFYNKRGVEHSPTVRLLVRNVAIIYEHATKKSRAQVLPVQSSGPLIRHHLKIYYGPRFKWLV